MVVVVVVTNERLDWVRCVVPWLVQRIRTAYLAVGMTH